MVSYSLARWNSARPVTASYMQAPSENTSARPSSSRPWYCSGDMYANLPLSMPASVFRRCEAALATPKSSSFTLPSKPTMMLSGVTSRCTSLSGRPSASLAWWA